LDAECFGCAQYGLVVERVDHVLDDEEYAGGAVGEDGLGAYEALGRVEGVVVGELVGDVAEHGWVVLIACVVVDVRLVAAKIGVIG